MFYLNLIFILLSIVLVVANKEGNQSNSQFLILISVIFIIIILLLFLSLIQNLNDSGHWLILLSESLENDSSKSDEISIKPIVEEIEIPEVVSFENNVVRFADGVESVLFQKKVTRQLIYYIEFESKKYLYEELEKGFKGSYLLKVKGIVSKDGLYNS